MHQTVEFGMPCWTLHEMPKPVCSARLGGSGGLLAGVWFPAAAEHSLSRS